MKRKLLSILLCLFMMNNFVLGVCAAESRAAILDNASLLSSEEISSLEILAQAMQERYHMDILILTVETTGYLSIQDYADNFYDENSYGQGTSKSGILFLLATEQREWYISTCGDAIYAVTDYGVQQLGEVTVDYLSDGNYYDGFVAYLVTLQEYLDAYLTDISLDDYTNGFANSYHGNTEYYEKDTPYNLVLSLVIGLSSAAVAIVIMRLSMNTKRSQRGASDYLNPGSYNLHTHQDLFLYSNVSKTRKQENTSSSGVGSSVHRSSSGHRHGGGGGKF